MGECVITATEISADQTTVPLHYHYTTTTLLLHYNDTTTALTTPLLLDYYTTLRHYCTTTNSHRGRDERRPNRLRGLEYVREGDGSQPERDDAAHVRACESGGTGSEDKARYDTRHEPTQNDFTGTLRVCLCARV